MGIYTKSTRQTILDALIAENPKMAGATVNDVAWGKPVQVTSNVYRIKVRGIPGRGWTGVAELTYHKVGITQLRLNLPTMSVVQYNATTLADLLPRLNQLYGLNLVASDLYANPALTGTSTTVALNLTDNLMYFGSISVTWTKGNAPQLWELYQKNSLTSLTVPDLMLKAFQIDYSTSKAVLEAVAVDTPLTTSVSGAQALVDLIASTTGKAVTLGTTAVPGTGDYDLSGFTLKRVTQNQLTDSNPSYKQIAVLTPPPVFGKQYSTIYLHYDKIVVTPLPTTLTVTDLSGFSLSDVS